MKTIWKFPLTLDVTEIQGLVDPKVVHVGFDPQRVACAWVEHLQGSTEPPTDVRLKIAATGQLVPTNLTHVGMFVESMFVWHVYEERNH